MNITHDKIADAAYVNISQNSVSKTVPLSDTLILDEDMEENLVGVEILQVSSHKDIIRKLEQQITKGLSLRSFLDRFIAV